MINNEPIGTTTVFQVIKISETEKKETESAIANEIPLTIIANDIEIATLSCLPTDLKELAYGFLFTSSVIHNSSDVTDYWTDTKKWRFEITLLKTPDPGFFQKRLYTSGCGKGVQFTTINEINQRSPVSHNFSVLSSYISETMRWMQSASDLHKSTGGVHTAALACSDTTSRITYDDVGRHNAVDKVIGRALIDKTDMKRCILCTTGRISSDILHKAKRADIAVVISLGAPTHQAVLLARYLGIALIGFARGRSLTIFSHEERILI